jgi:hypothetical protein
MKKIREWESRQERKASKFCELDDLFGGSQPAGNTTTVTKSDPWSGIQPYLYDLFNRGQHLANVGSPIAGQSPETLQSQQMQAQRAMSGSPLNDAAQQQNLATVRGDYLNPSTNPALQDAMNRAKTKINSQFTGDNYGNSAHQEWLGRGLMQAASPYYEAERGRQSQATALAPSLAQTDYTDIGLLGQVGGAKDARAQMIQDRPWENLFNYQKAIAGSGATGGTQTQDQPYFNNPLANASGAAMGAYALYSMFSDRSVKKNIKRIGTHPSGVGIYSFSYKWEDKERIGVMADEIEQVKPEAVGRLFGLRTVDYSMLETA